MTNEVIVNSANRSRLQKKEKKILTFYIKKKNLHTLKSFLFLTRTEQSQTRSLTYRYAEVWQTERDNFAD